MIPLAAGIPDLSLTMKKECSLTHLQNRGLEPGLPGMIGLGSRRRMALFPLRRLVLFWKSCRKLGNSLLR